MTLVELVVALVILGVIAAIAYPSYQESVLRARRSEAHTLLVDAANRQERFFADSNSYASSMLQLGYAADPAATDNGFYRVAVSAVAPAGCAATAPPSCTAFSLTATPQGVQTSDSDCTTISLDSLGQKTATGGGDCW
jgi:type IV pilus assembly protein PilE